MALLYSHYRLFVLSLHIFRLLVRVNGLEATNHIPLAIPDASLHTHKTLSSQGTITAAFVCDAGTHTDQCLHTDSTHDSSPTYVTPSASVSTLHSTVDIASLPSLYSSEASTVTTARHLIRRDLASASSCASASSAWLESSAFWSQFGKGTTHVSSTFFVPGHVYTIPAYKASKVTEVCDKHPRVVGTEHARIGNSTITHNAHTTTEAITSTKPYPYPSPTCQIDIDDCVDLASQNPDLVTLEFGGPVCATKYVPTESILGYTAAPLQPMASAIGQGQQSGPSTCQKCTIVGGTARLIYWPVETQGGDGPPCHVDNQAIPSYLFPWTPTGKRPKTYVTQGITITSPSAAISISGVSRLDGCYKTVDHTIIPVDLTDLSSICGERSTTYGYYPFNLANLNYNCQAPNGSMYTSFAPGRNCYPAVPASAYFHASSNWDWFSLLPSSMNSTLTIADNYRPELKLPDELRVWATNLWDKKCIVSSCGVWDPPEAAPGATSEAPATVPEPMTTTGNPLPTSTPAVPAEQVKSSDPTTSIPQSTQVSATTSGWQKPTSVSLVSSADSSSWTASGVATPESQSSRSLDPKPSLSTKSSTLRQHVPSSSDPSGSHSWSTNSDRGSSVLSSVTASYSSTATSARATSASSASPYRKTSDAVRTGPVSTGLVGTSSVGAGSIDTDSISTSSTGAGSTSTGFGDPLPSQDGDPTASTVAISSSCNIACYIGIIIGQSRTPSATAGKPSAGSFPVTKSSTYGSVISQVPDSSSSAYGSHRPSVMASRTSSMDPTSSIDPYSSLSGDATVTGTAIFSIGSAQTNQLSATPFTATDGNSKDSTTMGTKSSVQIYTSQSSDINSYILATSTESSLGTVSSTTSDTFKSESSDPSVSSASVTEASSVAVSIAGEGSMTDSTSSTVDLASDPPPTSTATGNGLSRTSDSNRDSAIDSLYVLLIAILWFCV